MGLGLRTGSDAVSDCAWQASGERKRAVSNSQLHGLTRTLAIADLIPRAHSVLGVGSIISNMLTDSLTNREPDEAKFLAGRIGGERGGSGFVEREGGEEEGLGGSVRGSGDGYRR